LTERTNKCHFGCECPYERLTLVYYEEGCWCFPNDKQQWLCPQHAIKGMQNNEGLTQAGYLHGKL
jgi:hypothetical protein